MRAGTFAHCRSPILHPQFLIARKPFRRLVREIMQKESSLASSKYTGGKNEDYRIKRDALMALQKAAESYIAGLFEDTNLAAIHA